jgi:hypothetical protein
MAQTILRLHWDTENRDRISELACRVANILASAQSPRFIFQGPNVEVPAHGSRRLRCMRSLSQVPVNTPSASADGFSDKLCGNPLAWRLKAGSRPEVCPGKNDTSSSNVPVERAATRAAMHSLAQGVALDVSTIGTRLAGAAWIDQFERTTGAFSGARSPLCRLPPSGSQDQLPSRAGVAGRETLSVKRK